jgi:hypothetical protein
LSKTGQVDLSWNWPYQFNGHTHIWILHERLEWVSILSLLDWCSCSELQANLVRRQMFVGVCYFIDDRHCSGNACQFHDTRYEFSTELSIGTRESSHLSFLSSRSQTLGNSLWNWGEYAESIR